MTTRTELRTALEELQAQARQEKHPTLSREAAVALVLAEDPDLYARYLSEVAAGETTIPHAGRLRSALAARRATPMTAGK